MLRRLAGRGQEEEGGNGWLVAVKGQGQGKGGRRTRAVGLECRPLARKGLDRADLLSAEGILSAAKHGGVRGGGMAGMSLMEKQRAALG